MKKQIGAYIVTHAPTGYYYIGSTGDFIARAAHHKHRLDAGKHANHKLQSIFTAREDLEFEFFPTTTREEAYQEEQKLLDKCFADRFCCNTTPSATNSTIGVITREMRLYAVSRASLMNVGRTYSEARRKNMSAAQQGSIKSDETKAAISLSKSRAIEINGVRYLSIAVASATLGINANTIRTRLRKCSQDGTNEYRFVD